ncbi:maleylpyruvate isomerase family mycothiol-dependent enzyme [Jiangella rhizosphaerae]|uniref:Maleylpyruvate isomerase family mycothiol-dependent enzyme n=1 Tax=Jiangella rhizosphaerae TaxID=2293569 RepID=A0A418KWW0_9ACTN|nr:maleylpyruvate isomerase family mycothiol-dependent enzyme [Jiangella rhizosphaerae]RIQ36728.1 maleylpyruvate isomerase family mycothiol-dependent enzyme [Jiangella rhizosphaerae]
MAKRIDPATVWTTYRGGHEALRGWVAGLPPQHWTGPSVLPGWTVAELAAHIALVADSVTALAVAPRGVRAQTVNDYLAAYAPVAGELADRTRTIAADAGHDPARIVAAIDERYAAATRTVEDLGLDDVLVTTRRVPVRLGDYLLTRVIEIAVHADDLARSVPSADPPVLPRDTTRLAVRTLLDVLAERVPGRSVEVRVAPFAAVQCIEGPRHTRGTPPNTVDLTPPLWLRLAGGRTTWAEEVAAGTVLASGQRADLSPYLPLF